MRIGVSVATHIGNSDLAVHAEQLGFDTLWATDSQMLWSDVYSYLALAAHLTTRVTLGPLVAVAPTRLAPVTAQSIATVNHLAPGRTALAIGTAHTAMRTMGMEPMRVAAFADYLRVVRALLGGEQVEYDLDGGRHTIAFMQRDLEMITLQPRIPMYVSAFGPRTQRLAGRYGDGIVGGNRATPAGRAALEANLRAGAADEGREVSDAFAHLVMAPVAVLMPGEAPDGDPVLEAVGPLLLAQYHAAWHDYVDDPVGFVPPRSLEGGWEHYLAIVAARNVPRELQHVDIHEGHGTFVRDDERPLLTTDLIAAGAIVGEPDEVVERVRAVGATGVTEFVLRIGYTNARDTMSRFAQHAMPYL